MAEVDVIWMDRETKLMFLCLQKKGVVPDQLESLLDRHQELVDGIAAREEQETATSSSETLVGQNLSLSLDQQEELEREEEDDQGCKADLEECEETISGLISSEFAAATKEITAEI